MGYWEQIGRDNREERARRASLPAWRRALRKHAEAALVAASWAVAGVLMWVVLLAR